MRRRDFFGMAAAMPVAAAMPAFAARLDVASMKTRKIGKIDIVYDSPHSKPNGLQATREGLWVLDQGNTNYVNLVNYADGKVLREFQVDMDGSSGITVDDNYDMWITSTHNSLIIKCSPQDGKVIAKYWTPGAGRIYPMAGDPPAARSPLPPAKGAGTQEQVGLLASRGGGQAPPVGSPQAGGQGNAQAAGGGNGAAGARGGRGRGRGPAMPPGQLALTVEQGLSGTGAHGMEHRDGLLYFACPPARHVYVMDPKSWVVQAWWPVPGNRPHGVGWEGDTLWVADSNWRAFFRHDYKTGEIVEKIQLTEKDPLIHGATVHDGYMWYCDDMGYICNFKL
jgi:hypothetical protein